MFEGIKRFARKVISMFNVSFFNSVSDVVEESGISSVRMNDSINEWLDMYAGNVPWAGEDNQQLGIPKTLSKEVARLVTLEMQISITGSPLADFINEQFIAIRKEIKTNVEYACAGGGIVFKPYISDGKIVTEIIQANDFLPIAYNSSKKITGAYFIYRKWEGKKVYTRLEKHVLEGRIYKITNKAYKSMVEESIGSECSLTEVKDWEEIAPETTITDVTAPLFAYFRIPIGNNIDLNSPIGMSIFADAVNVIKEADLQWQRYLWEYEGGEMAIDASADAFKRAGGMPELPKGKERLYRVNNIDPASAGGSELMKAWTPALRDANYHAGLHNILIKIEDSCSVSRGTLTEVTELERTAYEMKILKQRSYALINDIQTSLGAALDDLAYAMYVLCVLYDLVPDGTYSTSYTFDDSIIVDAETERMRDMQEVAQGLMAKYEYRMKWYGEDEATARRMANELNGLTDDELIGFERDNQENDE